ncbi:IS630 family transposase [Streptomyces sp. PSKA30]|uniref:IS630 family transposase n=1 Tax=Streptomyces sp. PSKA30 TaxID=2874597 RepID=UPI001CD18BC4|nr:IS630 family transposase [Streptomyces sp. PSKA30]MBZ9644493.1 IS630 family transposase [Streptomyces sp. PSKA30]
MIPRTFPPSPARSPDGHRIKAELDHSRGPEKTWVYGGLSTRAWLEDHPRIHHAFIPVGACRLNLQEGWWRIFRKAALTGRSFANQDDIAYATALATSQLNSRANAWIWGRPASPTRSLRRRYVYTV